MAEVKVKVTVVRTIKQHCTMELLVDEELPRSEIYKLVEQKADSLKNVWEFDESSISSLQSSAEIVPSTLFTNLDADTALFNFNMAERQHIRDGSYENLRHNCEVCLAIDRKIYG